jgi:hypothetical protein
MAGFESGIFSSVGGRDDHYTTPPGHRQDSLGAPCNGIDKYGKNIFFKLIFLIWLFKNHG